MKPVGSVRARTMLLLVASASAGWLAHREFGSDARLPEGAGVLADVLSRIEHQYVEDVDLDDLYGSLASDVVRRLGDPYSRFIAESDWEEQRIRVEGDYGGVGMEVVDQDGHITVVAPIPGTPAAKAGIRPGDRIVEVDGESVEGWATNQAVPLLRGKPGTDVRMGVRRLGVESIMSFEITRERVRVPQVPFAMLLEGSVGYVPLASFGGSAAVAVRAAIDSLAGEGMRSLALDLRRNPGGLLEEGLELADVFLDKGLEVAEIRGRDVEPDVYQTKTGQAYPDLPVVVLVDRTSASASEIVAGALQDHDRALLVGARTFGKGLVQSLIPVSGGAMLRLTTARWYTPAGRMIHGHDEAVSEMREGVSTILGTWSERPADLSQAPQVASRAGRTLYGGGGITPDLWILGDTLTAREATVVDAVFESAGGEFYATVHRWAVRHLADHPGLAPGFEIADEHLEDLHAALTERGLSVGLEEFMEARRFFALRLASETAHQAWGDQGRFERQALADAQLQKARELLATASSPEELFALAGTPIAQGR